MAALAVEALASGHLAGGIVVHKAAGSERGHICSHFCPAASSAGWEKNHAKPSLSSPILGARLPPPSISAPLSHSRTHSRSKIRALTGPSADGSESDEESKLAPLVPQSPTGQLLEQLLKSHPHLFPAAAEQQLERLVAEKSEELEKEAASASGNDLVLYKRIADIRSAERRRAIEEVIYALIVQRFIDSGASLLPTVPFISAEALQSRSSALVSAPPGPPKDRELLAVHSEEAREMVKEHLSMILGPRPPGVSIFNDDKILVLSSKVKMGQVYAASIMYGYFLRRVDQRFQLEKTMKALAEDGGAWSMFEEDESVAESASSRDGEGAKGGEATRGEQQRLGQDDAADKGGEQGLASEFAAAMAGRAGSLFGAGEGAEETMSPLKRYIVSFDAETLQKNAKLRSAEGVNVIEKHTEALFGRPGITLSPDGGLAVALDDSTHVSLATLRRLMLEAVAFGSFLWDVETFVDARYDLRL